MGVAPSNFGSLVLLSHRGGGAVCDQYPTPVNTGPHGGGAGPYPGHRSKGPWFPAVSVTGGQWFIPAASTTKWSLSPLASGVAHDEWHTEGFPQEHHPLSPARAAKGCTTLMTPFDFCPVCHVFGALACGFASSCPVTCTWIAGGGGGGAGLPFPTRYHLGGGGGPPTPLKDWTKFSSGPLANQKFFFSGAFGAN